METRIDYDPNCFITSLQLEIPSDGSISTEVANKAEEVNVSLSLFYKALVNPDFVAGRASSFQVWTQKVSELQGLELSEAEENWFLSNKPKINQQYEYCNKKAEEKGIDISQAQSSKEIFESRPGKALPVQNPIYFTRTSAQQVDQSYADTREETPSCCKCCC